MMCCFGKSGLHLAIFSSIVLHSGFAYCNKCTRTKKTTNEFPSCLPFIFVFMYYIAPMAILQYHFSECLFVLSGWLLSNIVLYFEN